MNQSDYDNSLIFVPISSARDLLDYTTQASAVEIKTIPGSDISIVKQHLSRLLGQDYKIADRMEQQENSFRMIQIEKWISFLMLAFILVIASFNVISTLSMLITWPHCEPWEPPLPLFQIFFFAKDGLCH